MDFPTLNAVTGADMAQLKSWWSKLPTPKDEHQGAAMVAIKVRILEAGEKLPPLSKAMGWSEMTPRQFKKMQSDLRCSDAMIAHLLRARADTVRQWRAGKNSIPRYVEVLLPLLLALDRDDCTLTELRQIAGLVDNENLLTKRDMNERRA